MADWIEINLPWYHPSFDYSHRESIVDYNAIQVRAKNELGKSHSESINSIDDVIEKEYITFINNYEEEHPNALSSEAKEAAWQFEKFIPIKIHQDFIKVYHAWYDRQPEVIEQARLDKLAREANNQKSFCGRRLNNAGTLIEYISSHDGLVKQALIGTINQLGGVCDDCRDIESNDIVKRYKVVYNMDDNSE